MRKINSLGVISTIAGNGVTGFSGDGGPATAAKLDYPADMVFDANGNIILADEMNHVLRKINIEPDHKGDSFSVYVSTTCSSTQLTVEPKNYVPGMNVKTLFGDGSFTVSAITSSGYVAINHSYVNSGTYTIKHILYNGATAIDTLHYSYTFLMCNVIPVKFYIDNNSNCFKDTNEYKNVFPLTVQVDSNGISIDTISATSGANYTAYGNPGDVYKLKVVATPPGLTVTCPSGGIIIDTLAAMVSNPKISYFGFACSATPGLDLQIFTSFRAGFHHFGGMIIANNTYCTPSAATITMQLSPKYTASLAFTPAPSSTSGNTVTWNVGSLSSVLSTPFQIHADMEKTLGVPLPFGDTVMTRYSIDPVSGDTNPASNAIIRVDTVQASYDPNDIAVDPNGCVSAGITALTYTIRFENTGSDTAFNIYVLDTLPSNVDPGSLRIVAASAAMDISINKTPGYTIVKFDFPDINLLDSSHHGLNKGMIVYTINMKSGLGSGTVIPNRAGIYFDDNPVVLTNTIQNVIGCPTRVNEMNMPGGVELFPNPASNELTIRTTGNTYQSIAITNTMGQQLLQQTITTPEAKVNVSMLPAGLYYITVKGAEGSVVRKFIKAD